MDKYTLMSKHLFKWQDLIRILRYMTIQPEEVRYDNIDIFYIAVFFTLLSEKIRKIPEIENLAYQAALHSTESFKIQQDKFYGAYFKLFSNNAMNQTLSDLQQVLQLLLETLITGNPAPFVALLEQWFLPRWHGAKVEDVIIETSEAEVAEKVTEYHRKITQEVNYAE